MSAMWNHPVYFSCGQLNPHVPHQSLPELRSGNFFLLDMVVFMKTVADLGGELTTEERNLLSVAYKNVIGARRAAWRMLSSLEDKVDDEVKTGKHKKIIEEYKKNIEKELRDICEDIIHLLKESLIKSASEAEARVFFLKM